MMALVPFSDNTYIHLAILIVVISLVYSAYPLRTLEQHFSRSVSLGHPHARVPVRHRRRALRSCSLYLKPSCLWVEPNRRRIHPPICPMVRWIFVGRRFSSVRLMLSSF